MWRENRKFYAVATEICTGDPETPVLREKKMNQPPTTTADLMRYAVAAPAAASTPDASALCALLVSAAVVSTAALAARFARGLSAGGRVNRSAWACCASRSSTHARLAMLLFAALTTVARRLAAPLSMQYAKLQYALARAAVAATLGLLQIGEHQLASGL